MGGGRSMLNVPASPGPALLAPLLDCSGFFLEITALFLPPTPPRPSDGRPGVVPHGRGAGGHAPLLGRGAGRPQPGQKEGKENTKEFTFACPTRASGPAPCLPFQTPVPLSISREDSHDRGAVPAPWQTVGCGDSGLDIGNCYLADPSVPFLQNVRTDRSGLQVRPWGTLSGLQYGWHSDYMDPHRL
jgi:hypothetical protein